MYMAGFHRWLLYGWYQASLLSVSAGVHFDIRIDKNSRVNTGCYIKYIYNDDEFTNQLTEGCFRINIWYLLTTNTKIPIKAGLCHMARAIHSKEEPLVLCKSVAFLMCHNVSIKKYGSYYENVYFWNCWLWLNVHHKTQDTIISWFFLGRNHS